MLALVLRSTGHQFYIQRGRFDYGTGFAPGAPRQFLNEISAYIDGTLFYGPFKAWTDGLRDFACNQKTGCGLLAEDNNECSSAGCGSGPGFAKLNTIGFPIANPPVAYYHGIVQDADEQTEAIGRVRNLTRQYLVGNPRANENAYVVAIATIFHRHHNWWAKRLYEYELAHGASVSDEEIFLEARKWNIATYQHVVFEEWLPQMLNRPVPIYRGYDTSVTVQISNIFQSAAGRYGHTQVTPGAYVRDGTGEFKYTQSDGVQDEFDRTKPFLDANGVNRYRAATNTSFRAIRTCNSLFRPRAHVDQRSVTKTFIKSAGEKRAEDKQYPGARGAQSDEIVMGLASQVTELEDNIITPDLRGFVFGALSSSRRDLMAINIMRGRDHGLPDYNTARAHYGLKQRKTFDEICEGVNPNCAAVASGLRRVYGQTSNDGSNRAWSVAVACQPKLDDCKFTDNVDAVDIWPGGILETNAYQGHPGELFRAIMLEQWTRIRNGDRFWYENPNNGLFASRFEIDDELREYNSLRFQRPRASSDPLDAEARPRCRIMGCWDTEGVVWTPPNLTVSQLDPSNRANNAACGFNGNPDYGDVGYLNEACPGTRTRSATSDDGKIWLNNALPSNDSKSLPLLSSLWGVETGAPIVGMSPCHHPNGSVIPDHCYPWPGSVDPTDPVAVNAWLSARRGQMLRPVNRTLSTNCSVVCDRRDPGGHLEASAPFPGKQFSALQAENFQKYTARADKAVDGQFDTVGKRGEDRTPMPFYPSSKGIRVSDVMRRVMNPNKRWYGFSVQDDSFTALRVAEQLGEEFMQPKQLGACNQSADFMATHVPEPFHSFAGVHPATGDSTCDPQGYAGSWDPEAQPLPQECSGETSAHKRRVVDGMCPPGYEERDLEDCTPPQSYDWYAQSSIDLPLVIGLGVFASTAVVFLVVWGCIQRSKARKAAQARKDMAAAKLKAAKKREEHERAAAEAQEQETVVNIVKFLRKKRQSIKQSFKGAKTAKGKWGALATAAKAPNFASLVAANKEYTVVLCTMMSSMDQVSGFSAIRIKLFEDFFEIHKDVGVGRLYDSRTLLRALFYDTVNTVVAYGAIVQLKVENSFDVLLHFSTARDATAFAEVLIEEGTKAHTVKFVREESAIEEWNEQMHFAELDLYLKKIVTDASANIQPRRDRRMDEIALTRSDVNKLLKFTRANKDLGGFKRADEHFGDTLFRVCNRVAGKHRDSVRHTQLLSAKGTETLAVGQVVDFLCKLMNTNDTRAQDRLLFDMIDHDGDGTLDLDELAGFNPNAAKELTSLLKQAGIGVDGVDRKSELNWHDFKSLMRSADDVYHRRSGHEAATDLQATPWRDWYAENIMIIFWLFLFTVGTALIFVERAYYYSVETEHGGLRRVAGYGVTTTRGAAQAICWTYSLVLLPMCRNTITAFRSTPIARVVPFDEAIPFHKLVAYTALFFTLVHIVGHVINFYHISNMPAGDAACYFTEVIISSTFLPFFAWWVFETVTGQTGFWCTVIVVIMFSFAVPTASRQHNFNWFWKTHQLYIVLYATMTLHGAAQIVQQPYFPYFFIPAALLFAFDKTISILRGSHKFKLKKAILHPSNVTELQLVKPAGYTYKSGQWARLKILEVSTNEWHPFTISSAPGEDYVGFHIRGVGPWTNKMRHVMDDALDSQAELPIIQLEGPFGEDHQTWWKHKTIILVGAGIGVTPFLSIIKDIVLSASKGDIGTTTTVYFAWVTPNLNQYEWCLDIIRNIENEPSVKNKIRFKAHIFITRLKIDSDFRTAMYGVTEKRFYKLLGKSLLTGLQAETHFGRPDWADFFEHVLTADPKTGHAGHPGEDVTIFSCCSPAIRKGLDVGRKAYISRASTLSARSLSHITSNF